MSARADRRRSGPGTRRLTAEHGPDAVWVAVSHGDVIKAILADALGMHLDSFQRILVDPASISIVRYTADPPVRDHGQLDHRPTWPPCSRPPAKKPRSPPEVQAPRADAPVGGGLGVAEPRRPLDPVESRT